VRVGRQRRGLLAAAAPSAARPMAPARGTAQRTFRWKRGGDSCCSICSTRIARACWECG
jgi:hypothetical protein